MRDTQADLPLSHYPTAERPARRRRLNSGGVSLQVYEWGDIDSPAVLACHGGMDFAATWDLLAPRVTAAGYRFVSWDQRGHGDSDHTALYSWEADIRDAVAVLDSIGTDPIPVIGHSKGGSMMMQLAEALPHRVSHLVNLDGLPSKRPQPDVTDHDRTRLLSGELQGWLDFRRALGGAARKPGTLDDLARRRQKLNPRLPIDWLRYLAGIGARQDVDGWRWKLDPVLRPGGFGPWRPEWSILRLSGLAMPVLAVLGLEVEMMSWGTTPDDVRKYLPPGAVFAPLEDAGHFVHIEQPDIIAGLTLDLIGRR